MRVGWNFLLRRKGRWTIANPSTSSAQQTGNSWEPRMHCLLSWQHSPAAPPCVVLGANQLGPSAASDFVAWQVEGYFPNVLGSISAQLGRCLQEPDPRDPSSLCVSKPRAVCLAGAEPHISLPNPLTLQPCHCCRSDRGQPFPHRDQMLLGQSQRQQLKQTASTDRKTIPAHCTEKDGGPSE